VNGLRANRPSRGASRGDGGSAMRVDLDPGPAAALEARAVLGLLDGRVAREVLDDLRLLVSELVTNSVRHSGADTGEKVSLAIARSEQTVRVEVTDPGPGFKPGPRTADYDTPGGWGLHLVDRIAHRWGVVTGRHTLVWFEIDDG
jgi:anti-sigma regulatory factor (Ser/Thr protein kinase)